MRINSYQLCMLIVCVICSISGLANNVSKQVSSQSSGGINYQLFTGQAGYSIPIYKLDDPDFQLDIALRYQSDGFKPFQPSGFYGQDWSLVTGGCISRLVQGIPDEQNIVYYDLQYNSPKYYYAGMHYVHENGCVYNKDLLFAMSLPAYDMNCSNGLLCSLGGHDACWWDVIDYLPDIFHFDFMGHKGSFIINNEGLPTIISGEGINIDLSHWSENHDPSYYEYSYYTPPSTKIIITTNDGYKYVFGGTDSSLEFTTTTDPDKTVLQEVPAVTKWYLTKIIAPNSREMSFNYKYDYWSGHHLRFFSTDYDWCEQKSDTTNIIRLLHKQCLLESIATSDSAPLEITFNSSQESHRMYEHPDYSISPHNLQLDSIAISCMGRTLLSANLSYNYKQFSNIYGANNYYWRYLSSVKISGLGTYTLSYYDIDPFPATAPPALHEYTYPSLLVTTDTDYKSLVDRRGFWRTTSLQGMLKQVSLPTGGKVLFTYGEHQYSEERRFRKINTCDVELYSVNAPDQTIGGARITKIETLSDANTLVEKDTFVYTNPNSTVASGIYYNIYDLFDASGNSKAIVNPYNYGMIDSHIGYAHVTRHKTIGNKTYKTTYTFDTGHTSYTSVNNPMIKRRTNLFGYADSIEVRSGSLTHCDMVRKTGNLLAVESYLGNSIQKRTYFQYNGVPNTLIDWSAFGLQSLEQADTVVCMSYYSGHIIRKLLVYPNVLEQAVTYEYPSGSNELPLVSPTSYTYDTKQRKKQTMTIDSRGRKNFVRYTYPDDISSAGDHALGLLVRAHRINVPVEEISGYIDGSNNEYITSGIVNIYNVGLIATVYPGSHGDSMALGEITDTYPYLYRTKQLSLSEPLPVTEYQPLHVNNWNTISDPHYSLACEYQFDRWNRLLSSNPLGKLKTEYKWEGFFPVSKTTGDQTWTYTYIPYVGISSMTDPRGLTTCYTYDSVGRLVEVYQIIDGRKRILNAYQYHIKTE